MLRIVDLRAALESRGYGSALAGTLDLDLTDEHLPANAGRWRIELADGRAHVERGGTGALRLDARALAALYSSWLSAEELAANGRTTGDRATLARASAFFAGPAPHMPDMF
jgi:predicted acetyltransferase